MAGKLQLTLRTVLIVQVVLFLFLGWLVDHAFLARKLQVSRDEVGAMSLAHKLNNAIDRAYIAKNRESYEAASRDGFQTILEIMDLQCDFHIVIPTLVKAMRIPDKYDIDYTLSGQGRSALVERGRESIPTIVWLLTDSDCYLRRQAAECLYEIFNPNRSGMIDNNLSDRERETLKAIIESNIHHEGDEEVASWLRQVLTLLDERPVEK